MQKPQNNPKEFFKRLLSNLRKRREAAFDLAARKYIAQVKSVIEKNDELLKACRLRVPPRLTDFSYEVKRERRQGKRDSALLTIKFPHFRLPVSVSLRVRPSRYWTWVGEENNLRELLDDIREEDTYLLHQLFHYQLNRLASAGWTSEKPYDLYQRLNKKEVTIPLPLPFELVVPPPLSHLVPPPLKGVVDEIHGDLEKAFDLSPFRQYVESLKAVPEWGEAELENYELRLRTFITLTDGYLDRGGKEPYSTQLQQAAEVLPDWVWQALPVDDFRKYSLEEDNYFSPAGYRFFKVVPDRVGVRGALTRQFFENLVNSRKHLIFALAASGGTISFEVGCAPEDAELVERQLGFHFPGFAVSEIKRDRRPDEGHDDNLDSVYRLSGAYRKIRTLGDFHLDPYRQLCEVMSALLDESVESRFEVWCKPFPADATRTMTDYLAGNYQRYDAATEHYYPGDERFEDKLKLFEKKIPAWWVNLRVWAFGNEKETRDGVLRLREVLRQYETFDQKFVVTYVDRGNLVGLDELVSLAHFPTADLGCERLEFAVMKAKLPPPLYAAGETKIGVSEARGQTRAVYLPEEIRDRHVYLVGKSGTGKSTLLEAIVRRDLEAGGGLAVIDPHGDMIRHLMKGMPEERLEDCIYFSPKHSPVSLEILAATTEHEIDLLADDLITMFRRTSESWGDKMQAILQMTFQTLLRVPGSSFTDITPLLTDKNYRARVLAGINHPQLVNFWENRFDVRQAEPILIRMDRLTTSRALRGVLTQHEKSLNFYDVITGGKIFLADLSKGDVGESTSHLLGSIIVSQIQLAAMRQAQLPGERRVPFSLFVDEVQNFTTSAFSTILSEARKYKLRLTIAHQFVSQLPVDIQKAVFGNIGTMVFFSMSPDDLGAARHELGTYEPADVANLPKYHALCRPSTAARDTFSFATLPPESAPQAISGEKRARIIARTQERFAPPIAAASSATPKEKQMPLVTDAGNFIGETLPAENSPPQLPSPKPENNESNLPPTTAVPPDVSLPPEKNEIAERGNQQHRYLQSLVKRMGESRNFLVALEKEVFGGVGRIDVTLENQSRKIACEISVTNEPDYEVRNIRKALAAGFSPVVVISADLRHLAKIRQRAEENLAENDFLRAKFFTPEEFHTWLENLENEVSEKEEKVKGFRVKVKLKPVDETNRSTRKKAISEVVFGALKKLGKDEKDK